MQPLKITGARGDSAPGRRRRARPSACRTRRAGRCALAILLVATACDRPVGTEPRGQSREQWLRRDADVVTGTPYADRDLVVYATFDDTRVVALDPATGGLRWEQRLALPTGIAAFPPDIAILAYGELLLVSAWDLFALDRHTGQLRYVVRLTDDYAAVGRMAVKNGRVYSAGRRLYAIEAATGEVQWQTDLGGEQPFGPVVTDEVIYVGTRRPLDSSSGAPLGAGHAIALRAADGAEIWRHPLPDAPDAPWRGGAGRPGIITGDLFLIASWNARLYALDRHTGHLRWQYRSHMPFSAGVTLVDSVAVVGNNTLEGVSIGTGQRLWARHIGSTVDRPLSATGRVALASVGRLYALDAGGKERWGHGGAGWDQPVYNTPAVVNERTIYIGSFEGLHALRLPDELH